MGLIENTPVPISQHEDEFSVLLTEYQWLKPKAVLEIGTHHGGTLYHWIKKAPDGARVNSIDNQHINLNLYDEWADNRRVEVNWWNGTSHSEEAYEWAKIDSQYDFIFIDGDHSLEGVKDDWMRYKSLIGPGGIIAFHDILPHPPWDGQPIEVHKLWAAIKESYKTEEIIGSNVWPDASGIGVVYFD